MIAKKDAAAIAGWSMNPHVPVPERLNASRQVLDFYVDQQQLLLDLLTWCRSEEERLRPLEIKVIGSADIFKEFADRLAAILEDED